MKRPLLYLYIGIVFIVTMPRFSQSDDNIKKPNVSGQFYEADPKSLSFQLDHLFQEADNIPYEKSVEIIISPHAGYVYSGAVAAHSFKAVQKQKIRTVVILAPSHFVGFDGISVWKEGGFETPLGVVDVDKEFAEKLLASSDKVLFNREAFAQEHSLEVEIPFLQKTFKDFKIVPVVMGQPTLETLEDFAATLKAIIADRQDVLIVVSTDLSHYHDDATAREIDGRTIKAIEALDVVGLIKGEQQNKMEMCGFIPVVTALLYAKQRGLDQVDILEYANSGDVTSDKKRVVGYTSIAIYGNNINVVADEVGQFTREQKKRLLTIAQNAIDTYIRTGKKIDVKEVDPRMSRQEGAFVTLKKKGHLRGCIGNVIGSGPLYRTVRDMAIAAATEDPRFSPVVASELAELEIEVSVLSEPRVIDNIDEIQLGVHGVIVSRGVFNMGLFLPQVATEWGWSKEEFLSRLCSEKAGLPADAWKDPKTKIEIFTTESFSAHNLE